MSAILSFIGWAVLPSLVTGWVVTIWYRLTTRAGDPIPAAGSPSYNQTHKRAYAAVVSLYLLYTIYESYHTITTTPNFYDLLQIPHTATASELKSRFRRLTVQFHPDKVGSQGADHFVLLKTAFDTLTDPAHRFAYERFGPSMLDWENCKTPYDYVFHGASALVPTYGGSLGVLIVIAVLGKFNVGRWWRFYVLSALLMFEFALVSRPFPLLPALPLLKPLLAFEQSALARKIAITSFVALNQLGPGLGAKESKVGLEEDLEKVVKTLAIVKAEAAKAQQTEFLPFEKDLVTQKTLEKKISSFLAESAIRNDPEVRAAVVNVMKSRADAARAQKDE